MCNQVMNADGHTSSVRDKILTITVRRGWKPNTRITFPKEGDQGPNNVPGEFAYCILPEPSRSIQWSQSRFEQCVIQRVLCCTADVIFIIKDKPHNRFRREGANLIFKTSVLLAKALTGCTVDVHTLDERVLHVPINDIIRFVALNSIGA